MSNANSWTSKYDFTITEPIVSTISISSRISSNAIIKWTGDSPLDVRINNYIIRQVMNDCIISTALMYGPCTIQIGYTPTIEFYFIHNLQFQNAISGSKMVVTWTGGIETVTITDGITTWPSSTSTSGHATFDLSNVSSGAYSLLFKSALNDVTKQFFFIHEPIISNVIISSRINPILTWNGDGPLNIYVHYNTGTTVLSNVTNMCSIPIDVGPCTIQIGNNPMNTIIPFYFISNIEISTAITGRNMTVTWTGGPEALSLTDGITTLPSSTSTSGHATFDLSNIQSGNYDVVFKNKFIPKSVNSTTFHMVYPSDPFNLNVNWTGDMLLLDDTSLNTSIDLKSVDQYVYGLNSWTSNYIVTITDPVISDIKISRIVGNNRITWTGDKSQLAYLTNGSYTIPATYNEDISSSLGPMTGPCTIQIGTGITTEPFYFIFNLHIDNFTTGTKMNVTWDGGPEIISLDGITVKSITNSATFDLEYVKAGNYFISFKSVYNTYATSFMNYIKFSMIATAETCKMNVSAPGDVLMLTRPNIDIYTEPQDITLSPVDTYVYYTKSFTSNFPVTLVDPIISDIYISRIIGDNKITWTGDHSQFAYLTNGHSTITATYNEPLMSLDAMTGPCTVQVGNNPMNITVPFYFIRNLTFSPSTYSQTMTVTWTGGPETISLMDGTTTLNMYQSQVSPATIALIPGTYNLSFKNAFIPNFTYYSTFTLDLSAYSIDLKFKLNWDTMLLTNGTTTVPYTSLRYLTGEYRLYYTCSFTSISIPITVQPPIQMTISPSTIFQGETFNMSFSSLLTDSVTVKFFDTISKIYYPAAFAGVNNGFIIENTLGLSTTIASMCGDYNNTRIITLPSSTYNVLVYDMSVLFIKQLIIQPSTYTLSANEMLEGEPFKVTYTNPPRIPMYFSFMQLRSTQLVKLYPCIGDFALTDNNYYIWGHTLTGTEITVTTRHNSADGPNGIKMPYGTYTFVIQNEIGQFLFIDEITIYSQNYGLSSYDISEGQPFILNCVPFSNENSYVLIGNDLELSNSYLAIGLDNTEKYDLWGIPLNLHTTITTLTSDSTIPLGTYKFRVMNSSYVLVYSTSIIIK
jgi:hypothetical protein